MHFLLACQQDGQGAAMRCSPVRHQRAAGLLEMPVFVERDHCRPAASVDDLRYAAIDGDAVKPDKGLVGCPNEAEADCRQHAAGGTHQRRLPTIKLADKLVKRGVRASVECGPGLARLCSLS